MTKILIATLALALVACGDDDNKKKSTNTTTDNNSVNNPNNPVNNPNNPVNNPNNPVNNPNNPVNNPNNPVNNPNNPNNPVNNPDNNPVNNPNGDLDLGPNDKTLAELTDAEAVAACKASEAFFYNNPYDCYLDGLFEVLIEEPATAAEAQMICSEAEALCLAEPIGDSYCDNETAVDCPVTLGQLEACYTAWLAQYQSLGTQPCSTVTPQTDQNFPAFNTPEECEIVEDICPQLPFGHWGS